MYTQCPHCQTTFALTESELKARDGLVRCGRCFTVFNATWNLIDAVSGEPLAAGPTTATPVEPVAAAPAEPERPVATSPAHTPDEEIVLESRSEPFEPDLFPETPTLTQDNHGPDWTAPEDAQVLAPAAEFPFSHRAEPALEPALSLPKTERPQLRRHAPAPGPRRSIPRTFAWLGLNLLLLAVLAGQFAFHYRDTLAHEPELRPYLEDACRALGCKIAPRRDTQAVELLETSMAPHPARPGALRVSATLVNRAAFAQPFPSLEVGLTNATGTVIGRRSYPPRLYLSQPEDAEAGMTPNVAFSALLDIAEPDASVVGYELQPVYP